MSPPMDDVLLTRRELCEFVRQQSGIPISYSRLMKDAAAGFGPPPAATFGKRFLYRKADALAYAKSLIVPAQNDGADGRAKEVPANWHAARPAKSRVSEGQSNQEEEVTS